LVNFPVLTQRAESNQNSDSRASSHIAFHNEEDSSPTGSITRHNIRVTAMETASTIYPFGTSVSPNGENQTCGFDFLNDRFRSRDQSVDSVMERYNFSFESGFATPPGCVSRSPSVDRESILEGFPNLEPRSSSSIEEIAPRVIERVAEITQRYLSDDARNVLSIAASNTDEMIVTVPSSSNPIAEQIQRNIALSHTRDLNELREKEIIRNDVRGEYSRVTDLERKREVALLATAEGTEIHLYRAAFLVGIEDLDDGTDYQVDYFKSDSTDQKKLINEIIESSVSRNHGETNGSTSSEGRAEGSSSTKGASTSHSVSNSWNWSVGNLYMGHAGGVHGLSNGISGSISNTTNSSTTSGLAVSKGMIESWAAREGVDRNSVEEEMSRESGHEAISTKYTIRKLSNGHNIATYGKKVITRMSWSQLQTVKQGHLELINLGGAMYYIEPAAMNDVSVFFDVIRAKCLIAEVNIDDFVFEYDWNLVVDFLNAQVVSDRIRDLRLNSLKEKCQRVMEVNERFEEEKRALLDAKQRERALLETHFQSLLTGKQNQLDENSARYQQLEQQKNELERLLRDRQGTIHRIESSLTDKQAELEAVYKRESMDQHYLRNITAQLCDILELPFSNSSNLELACAVYNPGWNLESYAAWVESLSRHVNSIVKPQSCLSSQLLELEQAKSTAYSEIDRLARESSTANNLVAHYRNHKVSSITDTFGKPTLTCSCGASWTGSVGQYNGKLSYVIGEYIGHIDA